MSYNVSYTLVRLSVEVLKEKFLISDLSGMSSSTRKEFMEIKQRISLARKELKLCITLFSNYFALYGHT